MPSDPYFRGGPLDGKKAPAGTSRYFLVPDYEGSILCATDDGPRRCFAAHRYERKNYAIRLAEPYGTHDGILHSAVLEYVGKEPAVPCGPILAGDRTVWHDEAAPLLNAPPGVRSAAAITTSERAALEKILRHYESEYVVRGASIDDDTTLSVIHDLLDRW